MAASLLMRLSCLYAIASLQARGFSKNVCFFCETLLDLSSYEDLEIWRRVRFHFISWCDSIINSWLVLHFDQHLLVTSYTLIS